MTPTVGRMVYYKSHGSPNGEYKPSDRAAVITNVHSPISIDLCVFSPKGLLFDQHVMQGSEGGQWDWMPFQKDQQARLESQIVVPETKREVIRGFDSAAFGFGQAIEFLKQKGRVARSGWNGKGMYLGLCEGGGFRDGFRTVDFIYMKTADDKITPWQPSQMDMLADDWMIVG